MPARIPKACREKGCAGVSTQRHGYCDAHAEKAKAKVWARSGRGRGGRPWRRLREQVKARANGLCEQCTQQGIAVAGTACDHIINKAEGGSDALSNLQWLCNDCHQSKTAEEAARGRQRATLRW